METTLTFGDYCHMVLTVHKISYYHCEMKWALQIYCCDNAIEQNRLVRIFLKLLFIKKTLSQLCNLLPS